MKKEPHSRRFNAVELFDRRYEVIARKEVEHIEELMDKDETGMKRDPLLSQAPVIIREELELFDEWASNQEDPRIAIVKSMKGGDLG